jgi:cobalt-zinc-cadmium efflux system protein
MSIGPHEHGHSGQRPNRAFAFAVGLNLAFICVEVVAGIMASSLALLADAGHNATDVLSLLLAWGASLLATRTPNTRRTYGLRRATILAALANSLLIMGAVGVIAWEAAHRFLRPGATNASVVIVVALVGVVINTATALLFLRDRRADLNLRAAFAHMAADAGISAGVVLSGVLLVVFGWVWIDPAVSILIAAAIVWGTWSILRGSFNLALDGVPDDVDLAEVQVYLASLPGVLEVHDLHVWALSTTETALTAHLLRPDATNEDELLREAARALCERFSICHITLQWERGDTDVCGEPCDGE